MASLMNSVSPHVQGNRISETGRTRGRSCGMAKLKSAWPRALGQHQARPVELLLRDNPRAVERSDEG